MVKAKKVSYDGYEFDSKTECDYYKYLKQHPNVIHIEVQPEYIIHPAYQVNCRLCDNGKVISDKTGRMVNCKLCKGKSTITKSNIKYTADFKVTYRNGEIYVIDVKGYKSQRDFPLRKKLWETIHKEELIVVRRDTKDRRKWKYDTKNMNKENV